jgi:hypothetical protein
MICRQQRRAGSPYAILQVLAGVNQRSTEDCYLSCIAAASKADFGVPPIV